MERKETLGGLDKHCFSIWRLGFGRFDHDKRTVWCFEVAVFERNLSSTVSRFRSLRDKKLSVLYNKNKVNGFIIPKD